MVNRSFGVGGEEGSKETEAEASLLRAAEEAMEFDEKLTATCDYDHRWHLSVGEEGEKGTENTVCGVIAGHEGRRKKWGRGELRAARFKLDAAVKEEKEEKEEEEGGKEKSGEIFAALFLSMLAKISAMGRGDERIRRDCVKGTLEPFVGWYFDKVSNESQSGNEATRRRGNEATRQRGNEEKRETRR